MVSDEEAQKWCADVEIVLRAYLDESYVVRFRGNWPKVVALDMNKIQAHEIYNRLTQLEMFLSELPPVQ